MSLIGTAPADKDGLMTVLGAYARRLLGNLRHCDEKVEFLMAVLNEEGRNAIISGMVGLAEAQGRPLDIDDLPSTTDASDLARELIRLSGRLGQDKIERLVEKCAHRALKSTGDKGDGPVPVPPCLAAILDEYRRTFGLTEEDCGVLLFYYSYELCTEFASLFDRVALQAKPRFMAVCTGYAEAEIFGALSPEGKLLTGGLLQRDDEKILTDVRISSMLVDGLSGFIGSLSHERFCKRASDPRFEVAEFGMKAVELSIAKSLLSGEMARNILFYGPPGTGKTECAKSLVASIGKEAWFLGDGRTGSVEDRQSCLALSAATLDKTRQVLVIDEADTLLSASESLFLAPRAMSKSWINNFLDAGKAHAIWIVNWTSGIDESAKRRFDFSHRFEAFTPAERRRVWERSESLRGVKLDPGTMGVLAEEYPVSAAGIDRALTALGEVRSGDSHAQEEPVLRALLESQIILSEGNLPPRERPLSREYDPSLLNISIPMSDIEEAVRRHSSECSIVPGGGPRFLFWGPPGTGKTEFCRYLASRSGSRIVIRRASDLFDKFVGGTEKNIAAAFREAERERAFLLFDEADSFLRSRARATQSWELTQVNEFLTQLERFSGVLACSTNFLEGLDAASLRRFQFKVEFRPLETSSISRLISRLFPAIVVPEGWRDDLAPIAGIVTPGDLEAVRERLRFNGRMDSWRLVIEELTRDLAVQKPRRQIGFGAP